MNNKHTPGPFTADDTPGANGEPVYRVLLADKALVIGSYAEAQADSLLFAAAPDLLAALEDLLYACQTAPGLPKTNNNTAAITEAIAAIKKAKGEE